MYEKQRLKRPQTRDAALNEAPTTITIDGIGWELFQGRTKAYQTIRLEGFPKPLDIGGRTRVWLRKAVLDWIANRPRREIGAEPSHLAGVRVRAGEVATRRFRDGKPVEPRTTRQAKQPRVQ